MNGAANGNSKGHRRMRLWGGIKGLKNGGLRASFLCAPRIRFRGARIILYKNLILGKLFNTAKRMSDVVRRNLQGKIND
jgi:hypothetical protein